MPSSLDLDLSLYDQIHFIGVGGISMSGLVEILLDMNHTISGSDIQSSSLTKKLQSKGAKIFIGHSADNITNDTKLVVYTAAVKSDNEELVRAGELNIPTIERAPFLGQIMKQYDKSISVAGTHGKTTTTSMMSIILQEANTDPTILVGGHLDAIGGNVKVGKSPYFITEACEYVESFLHFSPYIGIILNVEEDHLDYFTGLEHIKRAFHKFAQLVPENGYLIANGDSENITSILDGLKTNISTFGVSDTCDWQAIHIHYNEMGFGCFDVLYQGKEFGSFQLAVPGFHNIINALSAIACAYFLEIPTSTIQKGLLLFTGTHRRFELKGKIQNITVIDDYAHHPTEIKATLLAAKRYPHSRMWCVFQPHTYTRTITLLEDFSHAFEMTDEVIIADIYAAREKDTGLVHSKDLTQAIKKTGKDAHYLGGFQDIVSYLLENVVPGDMVITMGAGNIDQVGSLLLVELAK